MADKEIQLNGRTVGYGTGVKSSEETTTQSTNTFDGVVTQGVQEIGLTLEIDRLSYATKEDYIIIRKELLRLRSTPGQVVVREVIRRPNEEPYELKSVFKGVILDGRDYEMKPEENSVESLKFICGSCSEYVDGEEITVD